MKSFYKRLLMHILLTGVTIHFLFYLFIKRILTVNEMMNKVFNGFDIAESFFFFEMRVVRWENTEKRKIYHPI